MLICSMGAILFQGCSDYLEEEKIMSPPTDTYYKTEEGYSNLISSSYVFTRTIFNSGNSNYAPMVFYGTDLWTNGSDGSFVAFNEYNTQLNPSNPVLWNLWHDFYLGIGVTNTAISRADEVTDMTVEKVNSKVAEAYFLRAWYYHILVMHFGGVPLQTEEITEVVTTATRATEEEVYDQIISDLLFAEEHLPITQSNVGRVTKPAAQALLARIYLTLHQNKKAATYAKKVINDYDFHLLEDYADLWVPSTISTNAESIWSIQFSQNQRLNGPGGNAYFMYFTPRYDLQPGMTRSLINDRPWPRFIPTRYYLNLLGKNREFDSRFDKSWKTVWFANYEPTLLPNMQIGDTAFVYEIYPISEDLEESKKDQYLIYDINDLYNGENPIGSLELFPQMRKYRDPNRPTINSGRGTKSVMEIRLAEMYLIASEALMKTGMMNEAVGFINTLRRRAAWPGEEENMEITADELTLEFILEERALELGGERFRWADLKRTGTLIKRVNLYSPAGRGSIEEKDLLRPIPSNLIDRLSNSDEFRQNPGY